MARDQSAMARNDDADLMDDDMTDDAREDLLRQLDEDFDENNAA